MERLYVNKKFGTRQLVVIGMLSGISMFMGLTGFGMIPTPWMKITIQHLPVIIGAIIEGPIVGASIGFIFGIFSIYQNITAPTPMSPFFYNPIISILPRVLIGVISYYVYRILKRKLKNKKLSIGIAAICGSLTNTIGVLGSIYLIYFKDYASILIENGTISVGSRSTVTVALLSIIGTNGMAEAALSALVAIPVIIAIFKMQKRNS